MGKIYIVTYLEIYKDCGWEKSYTWAPLRLKKICNLSLKVFHGQFRGSVKKN